MTPTPGNDRFIGIATAAEMLRVSIPTLRKWVARAKIKDPYFKGLPYHQVAPRSQIKFDRQRLEFWRNAKTNVGSVNPL